MAVSILEEVCMSLENLKILVRGAELVPDRRSTQFLMQYLKTEEGFKYLNEKGWVRDQLAHWMGSEKWEYLKKFENKVVKYLDYQVDDNKDKGFKYLSYHLASNPLFCQTPSFLSAVMRLPWSIKMKCQNPGRADLPEQREDRRVETTLKV